MTYRYDVALPSKGPKTLQIAPSRSDYNDYKERMIQSMILSALNVSVGEGVISETVCN